MLHNLYTTNGIYLPAYLVGAIDAVDPDMVSTAYVNAIICPTTGKKQEFRHLIADPNMPHLRQWNV